jgi:hypothetical protein
MPDDVAEDDPTWKEACRREEVIRDLLRRYPERLTVRAVEEVAWELRQRGWPKGRFRDEPVRDGLIQQFLEREYLKPTRPPLRRVVAHIAAACRRQGLPAPTWRTVTTRLLRIDGRIRAIRRGETGLVRARIATPGAYEIARPLQVVQVDHTLVDIMIVDQAALLAWNGEQIMDRVHARHGDASTHTALMRSLLFPQALQTRTGQTPATRSRLLELVVPGSDAFFRRLAPEMWPTSSRILPLSVRVPVLAGVAVMSSRPEYWVERLVGAAAAVVSRFRQCRGFHPCIVLTTDWGDLLKVR